MTNVFAEGIETPFGNVDIHMDQRSAEPTAPMLVLMGGFGEGHECLGGLADVLSTDYCVFRYSNPGDRNDEVTSDPIERRKLVLQAVRTHLPAGDVTFVAHSMAGPAALRAIAEDPRCTAGIQLHQPPGATKANVMHALNSLVGDGRSIISAVAQRSPRSAGGRIAVNLPGFVTKVVMSPRANWREAWCIKAYNLQDDLRRVHDADAHIPVNAILSASDRLFPLDQAGPFCDAMVSEGLLAGRYDIDGDRHNVFWTSSGATAAIIRQLIDRPLPE